MTIFTIIIGALFVLGGIGMMVTPLSTFIGYGYFIIIMFFVAGLIGVMKGVQNKRYGAEFGLAVVVLALAVIALFVPGVAAMNNYIILDRAAGFFIIHGIVTILRGLSTREDAKNQGNEEVKNKVWIGILLGALELILGVYSIVVS